MTCEWSCERGHCHDPRVTKTIEYVDYYPSCAMALQSGHCPKPLGAAPASSGRPFIKACLICADRECKAWEEPCKSCIERRM